MSAPLSPLTGAPAVDDFTPLQNDVVGRLRSDRFFDDVAVIEEFSGTANTQAEEALGIVRSKSPTGKVGACVIVHEAERVPENPDAPGPQYQCEILLRVIELPTVNASPGGTKKSARLISQYAEQLFARWQNGPTPFVVKRSLPYSNEETGEVGRDVTLGIFKALKEIKKCPSPRINLDTPGTVVFGCIASGSVIRFTTDGSFPAMRAPNPTGPIVAGAVVRLVAYAPGVVASDLVVWTAPAGYPAPTLQPAP